MSSSTAGGAAGGDLSGCGVIGCRCCRGCGGGCGCGCGCGDGCRFCCFLFITSTIAPPFAATCDVSSDACRSLPPWYQRTLHDPPATMSLHARVCTSPMVSPRAADTDRGWEDVVSVRMCRVTALLLLVGSLPMQSNQSSSGKGFERADKR